MRSFNVVFGCIAVSLSVLSPLAGDLVKSSESSGSTSIPEFNPELSELDNQVVDTITITEGDITPGDTGKITEVFFTIQGLVHNHLSDLIVRVKHRESMRVATLFERVGITDASDNGFIDDQNVDGNGDSSTLGGVYRFKDGGEDLWAVADSVADGSRIPILNESGENNLLPVYRASRAENEVVSLTDTFASNGESNDLRGILGNWDIEFSDRSNQSPTNADQPQRFLRAIAYFRTQAVVIPEPCIMSGLLLGIVAASSKRRRNR